ncbi:hypothetical protein L9F63_005701 [Diploptera punctata]|uniref:Globin domain-containing protein n=1 Tax=Diploptera punctata TaxID=6984 RepID=A0AAD8E568_DIPPU|nr:hypothetical protein L9F63_005701 [Diploptera punctata]
MGATICHYLIGSESNEGICPICNKICPIKGKEKVNLTDKEKQLISESWNSFKEGGNENALEVLIICIKKSASYKRDLGIIKEEGELKSDSRVKSHADSVMQFVNTLVESINNQEKIQNTLTQISNYHQQTQIPISSLIIYKDTMIDFMLEKKMTAKEGSKAWHHFLDKLLDSLKKVAKETQTSESRQPSTSQISASSKSNIK